MTWLSGLPPGAIYATIAVFCLLENVFPPMPTDVAVTLAAFLAGRGQGDPTVVLAVAWVANTVGGIGVAFAARRLGRAFLSTPAGHRLISPRALEVMEREYLRHGFAGIVIARLLPGIRAVVPPFAGVFAIPLGRVSLAIAAAGAVWYAALVALGTSVSSRWDTIVRILTQVNRTLGIVTLLALAAIAFTILLRRRRARRAIEQQARLDHEPGLDEREAARLVLEIAYDDPSLSEAERAEVSHHLKQRWGLEPVGASSMSGPGSTDSELPPRMLRRWLRGNIGRKRRIGLVERMWSAALGGGSMGAHEEWLLRRASELLALTPEEVREVRQRMMASERSDSP